MEVFKEYGSDVVGVMVMLPYGIGTFIGAPLSGKDENDFGYSFIKDK